jgi:hypothetical protein
MLRSLARFSGPFSLNAVLGGLHDRAALRGTGWRAQKQGILSAKTENVAG